MQGGASQPTNARRVLDFTPNTDERIQAMHRRLDRTEALLERALRQNMALKDVLERYVEQAIQHRHEIQQATQVNIQASNLLNVRVERLERLHDADLDPEDEDEDDPDHDQGRPQKDPDDEDDVPPTPPLSPEDPSQHGFMTVLAEAVSDGSEGSTGNGGQKRPRDSSGADVAADAAPEAAPSNIVVQTIEAPDAADQLDRALDHLPLNVNFDPTTDVERTKKWWSDYGRHCVMLQPLAQMIDSFSIHAFALPYFAEMLAGAPPFKIVIANHPSTTRWCVFCMCNKVHTRFAIRHEDESSPYGYLDDVCFKRFQCIRSLAQTLRDMTWYRRNEGQSKYLKRRPQYLKEIQTNIQCMVHTELDHRWDRAHIKRHKFVTDPKQRPERHVEYVSNEPDSPQQLGLTNLISVDPDPG